MTPSPSPEPEFRGKSLTPVSPRPLHYPEPSTIPVLQNQMDPVFNDTSTHLEAAVTEPADPVQNSLPTAISNSPKSPASPGDDSETSSLYGTNVAEESNDIVMSNGAPEPQPVSDEYAMSLENGDDEIADDINANVLSQDNTPPATSVVDSAPQQVQASTSNESSPSLNIASSNDQISPSTAFATEDSTLTKNIAPPASSQVDLQALLQNISQPPPSHPGKSESQSLSPTTLDKIDDSTASQSHNTGIALTADTTALPLLANSSPVVGHSDQPSTLTTQTKVVGDSDNAADASNDAAQTKSTLDSSDAFPPPIVAAGAPGTSSTSSGLPPPPVATFQQPQLAESESPTTRKIERRGRSASIGSEDRPWTPKTQKQYDKFLQEERGYVAEAQWEKFPIDSRLFVGNLATEKVTKRDLFHVFHKYGRIAQISIKNAYGFIQFFETDDCGRALRQEQDVEIREKRCHLEISRPQRKGGDRGTERRRSRSPERNREGRGRNSGGRDRGGANRDRDRDRGRDDYRPGRSPSPRGYGNRGDSYRGAGERGRDRYDSGRKRSRSRSPYGRSTRYRDRSPTPPLDDDANLPLSRRNPSQVPEVQLIITEDLDRNFISYVERGFKEKGIRTDVLFLTPRLPYALVLKRQILEGVLAVVRIDRSMLNGGKIPLQVFDRQGGSDRVRFDDYVDLTPQIAAELVLRTKQTTAAPVQAQYGAPPPGYGMPQYPYNNILPPQVNNGAAQPNLGNLISSLDGQGLQKLLGSLQQQPPQAVSNPQGLPPANGGLPPEFAGLLGGLARPPQPGFQPQPQLPQQANQANPYGQPLNAQPPIPPQDPSRNVSSIMEQLAKWRQA